MLRNENDRFDSYNYLQFATGIVIGKYFWTTAVNFNGLYRINLEQWTAEEMATFADDFLGMELYTCKMLNVGNKLFIVPGRASCIAVFDTVDFSMLYIQIENKKQVIGCKFGDAFLYEKNIYLFPQCLQTENILKIDTETNVMSYCPFSGQAVHGNEGAPDIFMYGVKHNDAAWIGLGNKKAVMRFDFHTERMQIYDIKNAGSAIRDAAVFKNNLYLLTQNNQVIEFNPDTKKEKIIFQKDDGDGIYGRLRKIGECLWLLPSTADNIIRIDVNNSKHITLELSSELKKWKRWYSERTKISDGSVINGKIYLWPSGLDSVVILDYANLDLDYRPIIIREKRRKELQKLYISNFIKHNLGLMNENTMSLNRYLECVSAYEHEEKRQTQNTVGMKIYKNDRRK